MTLLIERPTSGDPSAAEPLLAGRRCIEVKGQLKAEAKFLPLARR